MTATEAAGIGRFGLGQQDIFLLKWISGVCGGVALEVEVQVHRIRALRVAGSSASGDWCSVEPSLASSSASSLPIKAQWPGTHNTSRHLSALSCATAACTGLIPSSHACELPTVSTSDLQLHMNRAPVFVFFQCRGLNGTVGTIWPQARSCRNATHENDLTLNWTDV